MKMEHNTRVMEEEKIKNEKEMEVLNMEQLEMELIRKLQQTQLLQKSAYEELETALSHPPGEYAKKFLGHNNHSKSHDGNFHLKIEHEAEKDPKNQFDPNGTHRAQPLNENEVHNGLFDRSIADKRDDEVKDHKIPEVHNDIH